MAKTFDQVAKLMAAQAKAFAKSAAVVVAASPGFLAAQEALKAYDALPQADRPAAITAALQAASNSDTHRRLWKVDDDRLVGTYDCVTLVRDWVEGSTDEHPGHGRIRYFIALVAFVAASGGSLPADGELSLKALGGK